MEKRSPRPPECRVLLLQAVFLLLLLIWFPLKTCWSLLDDSNDTDLCSGRPISGVTTLRNGTMVVFRGQGPRVDWGNRTLGSFVCKLTWLACLSGHYFWVLDRNRVPGAAQGITQAWGVPSPIDTVFTRCNCQGKTYIFKVRVLFSLFISISKV